MEVVVLKLGGASLQNLKTLESLALMLKDLLQSGVRPVIIHGGGPDINEELTRRGISWAFINGQRQTTPEMMEVIEEVLAKKVNGLIVHELKSSGLKTIGLSGAEDKILFCSQTNAELQQVGKVEVVELSSIKRILENSTDVIPVIAPIGVGYQGEKYNINADWAASKIAVALHATKLIFLTDQNGILDGEGALIDVATAEYIHEMIRTGVIHGGMYTKVLTMMMAIEEGISEVQVLNALLSHQYGRGPLGTRLVDNYSPKC